MRAFDARLPLLREDLKDAEKRQDQDAGPWLRRRAEGDEEAGGGEERVDEIDLDELGDDRLRLDPEPVAHAKGGHRPVDGELGAQRKEVDGPVRPVGRRRAEREEHQHGPDRVPRVAGAKERAIGVDLAAPVVGDAGEKQSPSDRERHVVRRQEEEHRDEDELRRVGPPGGDPELDPCRKRVCGHEPDGERDIERARCIPGDGNDRRGDDEREGRCDLHGPLAVE